MRVLLCVAGISSLFLPQVARNDDQRFFARTDVVTVDVSVLDSRGEPVRDLTASDFTLLEDGKPQKVEYFKYIELPAVPEVASAWMRDVAPDVARNQEVFERRLVVILMDDAMVPFDGQIVSSARKIARDVVDRLGAADLAAVVFSRANRASQNFTRDRARLLAAISTFDSAGFEPAPDEEIKPHQEFVDSLQTLSRTVEALSSVPERRKSVVFVSTGIPLVVDTPEVSRTDQPYLNWLARQVMDRAQRGSVNIYTVDPGGLDGIRTYMSSRNRRTEPWIAEQIERTPALYRDFLKAIADNTGGRAFINTNEFASRIDQMVRETGSFYLLGYRAQNLDARGRFRKLQVRVNRRDLTVHTRRGNWPPPASHDRSTPPPTDTALAGLVPKADVPLELTAAPFGAPGRREAAVFLTVGGSSRLRQGAESSGSDQTQVLLAAFTPEGDPRGAIRIKAIFSVSAPSQETLAYDVVGRLDLSPGRYEIRASTASASAGTSGSVYGYLEIPDFARDAVSLSGIVIGTVPPWPTANLETVTGVLPFAPTTRRVFGNADRVSSFLRVYQRESDALAPVTVVLRVIDAGGREVVKEHHQIDAAVFAGAPSADVTFDLPMARLAAGSYLYSVEATLADHAARRDVRFEVR